jgi:glycosyltransferase involved in cell wall biosynthesis
MKSKSKKPKIVLFSRYPIEFEVIPFQGFRKVIDKLLLNYEIVYYTLGWAKPKDETLRRGIDAKELPIRIDISSSMDKWVKTLLYYALLPFSILKLKNENPKVIICRENMPFVPLSLRLLNKPVLIEIGDWWPSMILGSTNVGKILANTLENLEVKLWNNGKYKALTHNLSEEKVVLEKGLAKKKIEIVTLPMFGNQYFPCSAEKERLEQGFSKKDFVVATHGIIHRSKGYDQVLIWWSRLVKEHPDWKLLFIGGTMGEEWFRKMIEDLGLKNNVIITGWVSDQNKLNKYLNCANCLLVTRRNTKDNFGTTPSGLTHSLMTGKPTVVTGMPSIHEIIQDRRNGYIFEPDNYVSFKKALEEIFFDKEKSKKIGLAGLKRVKEYFNPEKTAEQYKLIIDKALN